MRFNYRLPAAVVLLFSVLSAQAATGYRWYGHPSAGGSWTSMANVRFADTAAACARMNEISPSNSVFTMSCDASGPLQGAPASAGLSTTAKRYATRNSNGDVSISTGPVLISESYEYEDPCTASDGQTLDFTGSGGIPASSCIGGCRYTVGGVGVYLPGADVHAATGTGTGESCTPGSGGGGSSDAPAEAGNDCFLLNGNTVCGANTDEQYCGTVNNDWVCVAGGPRPAPEENTCMAYGSGGVACAGSSAPVPDNGTPGTPADPLVTVTESGGSTDYYTPETVEGSADPVPTSGTGAGSGGSGSSSSASSACMPGEECAGELPEVGEEGDCTFTECAADFVDRVQGSPLLSSISGVSAAFPSGSCPSWTLEAFGADYSLSAPMCSIWEDVSPFLSGVMLVVWGWVATRIVLSA